MLRRLFAWPRVERYVSTGLRARTVRESARFAARELWGGQASASYHVRESGLAIVLRHRTPDVFTLDQVFYQRHFDLPHEVVTALERREPLRILDLGANIGLFGIAMLGRFPGATVTAFEPDQHNAQLLERVIASNGADGSWTLVRACAGAGAGTVRFSSGEFGVSHAAAEGEAATDEVQAVDVFPYLAAADLAKIDIEGSEWELLADPRFGKLSTPVLHLEFHARQAPTGNPAEAAVRAVEEAGYEHTAVRHTIDGAGMLWAWRPEEPVHE
jgi:FkbM family methyltransferase